MRYRSIKSAEFAFMWAFAKDLDFILFQKKVNKIFCLKDLFRVVQKNKRNSIHQERFLQTEADTPLTIRLSFDTCRRRQMKTEEASAPSLRLSFLTRDTAITCRPILGSRLPSIFLPTFVTINSLFLFNLSFYARQKGENTIKVLKGLNITVSCKFGETFRRLHA